MKALTGLAGGIIDAWDEIRVHKTRIVLSLLGVLLAVAALTTVSGMGALLEKSFGAFMSQTGGEAVSFSISATGGPSADETADKFESEMVQIAERYDITYMTRVSQGAVKAQFLDGIADVTVNAVDVPYGDMRSVPLLEGSWFADDDTSRLAPALVVSDIMWNQLGSPPLAEHPTVQLTSPAPTTGVIVGVYKDPMGGFGYDPPPSTYMLADTYEGLTRGVAQQGGDQSSLSVNGGQMGGGGSGTTYSVWLPLDIGDDLGWRIKTDLQAALGPDVTVSSQRTDAEASGGGLGPIVAVITAVSSIVLLIGVVGYINLAILSVDNRVREIGIRRSFGATGSRVFMSVLLESVVGTTLAGLVGIGIAILVLSNETIKQGILQGSVVGDVPFPISAAITGLTVSVGVGILAGIVPAIIATRIKVIDALRL